VSIPSDLLVVEGDFTMRSAPARTFILIKVDQRNDRY